MRIINGVKTNLGGNYSICNGDEKKTMGMRLPNFAETDEEMFERLAKWGYKKITFYYTTTAIRGYYKLVAYVK